MPNVMKKEFPKDLQFFKFCMYGFFTHLKFFDPFFVLFFREMGYSFFQIGTLFAIRELSVILLEIPTGIIADVFGRRRAMVASFTFYLIFFTFIFFFGKSYWPCALAMIFYGLGDTFRSGTHKGMILEYLLEKNWETRKSQYYGAVRSWSQMGAALSALIAAALVFYSHSYRILFLATLVPYSIDLALILSYPPGLGSPKEERPGITSVWTFTVSSFQELVKNIKLNRTILNSSLVSSSQKVTRDYLQPIIKSWALTFPIFLTLPDQRRVAVLVGMTYFLIYVASSVASLSAGRVEQRAGGSLRVLNLNYVVNSSLYILAGIGFLLGYHLVPLFSYLLVFIIKNIQTPIMVAFVGEVGGPERATTMLSVENAGRALLVLFFAPLVGFLADILSVGGAISIFGSFLLILFPLARLR
jgi:MFS family permease